MTENQFETDMGNDNVYETQEGYDYEQEGEQYRNDSQDEEGYEPSLIEQNMYNNRQAENEEPESQVHQSLDLKWVFGMNKDIKNAVHNLGDGGVRKEIFYVAGHIGVIFDWEKRQQTLLQGHTHAITSTSVSQDKRWIVTADSGKDNMIVIWDSVKGIPIKTIFNPHKTGTICTAISPDNMFIVSVSAPDEMKSQTISIWQWTADIDEPKYTAKIASSDVQNIVRFHPTNPKLLVSNGPKRVIFWSWAEKVLKFYAPPVSSADFRQPVGEFTQSIFIPKTTLAATGTVDGDIVLWQQVKSLKQPKATDKRALKVVRVHDGPINVLTTINNKYIVTGGKDGYVRFFDYQLRLEAWFEEFDGGPITSISFENTKGSQPLNRPESQYGGSSQQSDNLSLADSKDENQNLNLDSYFSTPNFIVATAYALIISVHAEAFNDFGFEKICGELKVQGQEGPIQALAVHPTKPYLAITGFSSHLHLWDYEAKQVLHLAMFKENIMVTCIDYDPRGQYLALGTTSGVVKVLDGTKVESIQTFQPSKARALKITWSHDSLYFAVADSDNCVGIFKWGPRDEDIRKPIEWIYVGRYRSHKSQITDLQFGITPYGDTPRLFSVGEDRRLVEYDLKESSIKKGVKVKAVHKIGQSAVPTCFLWSQSKNLTKSYLKERKEFDSLIFTNDQYKFMEFVTPDAGRHTFCRKTFLCPTYGGPLSHMRILSDPQTGEAKFLAYCTKEKVIGLVHLPIDGNPNKTMGLIAHSGEIRDFQVSPDGRYIFTAGGTDHTVNQWEIRGEYLDEEASKYTDDDVDTFISLITGGKDGEQFFDTIKQYFYYAQIRSQGEVTTNERKISGEVPVHQVPYIIRALGFYATDYEIDNLMTELKTILGYSTSSSASDDELVDFDTFIKVYVNHRPVLPIGKPDIELAFREMGKNKKEIALKESYLRKDDLLDLLKTRGEKMGRSEIQRCIESLIEDESAFEQLEAFSSSEFAENVLGFEEFDEED